MRCRPCVSGGCSVCNATHSSVNSETSERVYKLMPALGISLALWSVCGMPFTASGMNLTYKKLFSLLREWKKTSGPLDLLAMVRCRPASKDPDIIKAHLPPPDTHSTIFTAICTLLFYIGDKLGCVKTCRWQGFRAVRIYYVYPDQVVSVTEWFRSAVLVVCSLGGICLLVDFQRWAFCIAASMGFNLSYIPTYLFYTYIF